ncbi:uncharacterized protein V6R79_009596 [Siganus canaliculatus]
MSRYRDRSLEMQSRLSDSSSSSSSSSPVGQMRGDVKHEENNKKTTVKQKL